MIYQPGKWSRPQVRPAADRPLALRVLAAVDGSAATGRVVDCLLDLHAREPGLQVVVLNIQPRPPDWRLRGYGRFQREEVRDQLVNELGRRITASVARHLDAARIAHTDRVELGDPVQTLLRCAGEEDCDMILLAEPAPGPLRRWLLRAGATVGSVASVLIHIAPVPVLVAR